MKYEDFIKQREVAPSTVGFSPDDRIFPAEMFDHQKAVASWACRRGRAGVFMDTGLGKTITQLSWAAQVVNHTGGAVLVLAPLAVAHQTVRESDKFGIPASFAECDDDIAGSGVYVTNYEKLHRFTPGQFAGVVLDESSILKGMQGRVRTQITEFFSDTPYRLSCTATPSPNDFMELGTQSEFLGVMSQLEMLAMFFIHDTSGGTGSWRLKGHGKAKFWEWLATWCVFLRSPADIGFDATGYDLPKLIIHEHVISTAPDGQLFAEPAQSLQERNKARRESVEDRCRMAAEIVNSLDEPCAVWCNLNDESKMLADLIDGSVEVTGSDTPDHKAQSLIDFADGKSKALITKPKIAGFGMNMQSSRHCVFVGLSDSWEAYYQAVRRQWRFGQQREVHCHIVSADTEGAVVDNIRRKDQQHEELTAAMMAQMADFMRKEVFGATIEKTDYAAGQDMIIPGWMS